MNVLAGRVTNEVWVAPGNVMVLVTGGTTKVLVIVENTVSAGSCMVVTRVEPGTVEVRMVVEGGSTMVESDVEMEVDTLTTVEVCTSVLVTTEISTRVTSRVCTEVGPSMVCMEVGPGTVSTEETVWVNESTCVDVLTTEIVIGTTLITVVGSPDTVVVKVVEI